MYNILLMGGVLKRHDHVLFLMESDATVMIHARVGPS